jgi:Skp family chaperone for outer membrane proteins
MKALFSAIAAILITTAALTARAQTTAPPIAQTPAAPTKIGIIDTEAFGDSKAGIKRLLNAYAQVSNELAGIRQQIATKSARYEELGKAAQTRQLTQAEVDEADNLKRDIQRLQEDGQKQADKLARERTGPILNDIGNAIQAYAKQRGFDMVIDVSKFQGAVLVLNQSVDITDAFILDYNTKNPGTTTTTPPKQP